MGTSSPFGGANPNTPLVPTWLQPSGGADDQGGGNPEPQEQGANPPAAPARPEAPQPGGARPASPQRFRTAKSNYTRFASSGGTDRRALNRAVSSYVSSGTGGARGATLRMGSARGVAAGVARLFSDIRNQGVEAALFARGIEYDGSRSAVDVLFDTLDRMELDGGPIDEAIARDAMVESLIATLESPDVLIGDVDPALYSEIVESFVAKSIVSRIIMDIGARGINVARDASSAMYIQDQLESVVAGAVSDSFVQNGGLESVRPSELSAMVYNIYRDSFLFLEALGGGV